jgi:hypothetical protein
MGAEHLAILCQSHAAAEAPSEDLLWACCRQRGEFIFLALPVVRISGLGPGITS